MSHRTEVVEPPVVSVICPVYNGGEWLREAVESIRAQTFSEWELILLDDGSSDGSGELCAELSVADPRVRHRRQSENRGLGATMASLVQMARGRFLAVQEQDDISQPNRLASEVALLDAEPTVGLVSGIAEWIDHEGQRIALFPGVLARGGQYPQDTVEMVRFLFLEQCKVVNAGCMFRREVLNSPGVSFDTAARMSIDWQFFLRLAHHWRIWGLPEVLVRVRRGVEHNSLSTQRELRHEEARRCIRLMFAERREDPESPINRSLYRQALATEMILEGRFWGGLRGVALLAGAAALEPSRRHAWSSLGELIRRGAGRISLAERRR